MIGVDAHPVGEAFGLTTIDQHARQQGTRAVGRLLERLGGGDDGPWNEVLPAHFVVRSSTGPAPA